MMGFTTEELMNMQEIKNENQEIIMPIMKENYNGYKFSVHGKDINSNMCVYFLADYVGLERIPESLVDVNIASDYSKMGKMLDLCKGENRAEIIEKTVGGEAITSSITEKFNPAIEFTNKDLISMLYYLGYLTIVGEEFETPMLSVPNKVMKEIYADYFMQILNTL